MTCIRSLRGAVFSGRQTSGGTKAIPASGVSMNGAHLSSGEGCKARICAINKGVSMKTAADSEASGLLRLVFHIRHRGPLKNRHLVACKCPTFTMCRTSSCAQVQGSRVTFSIHSDGKSSYVCHQALPVMPLYQPYIRPHLLQSAEPLRQKRLAVVGRRIGLDRSETMHVEDTILVMSLIRQ